MTREQHKKQKKRKKICIIIMIIIFSTITIYSSIEIIKWALDGKKTQNQIKEINEIAKIEEKQPKEESVTIVNEEKTEEIEEDNPYWDYIQMPMINVDFNELKNTNSDTVGWIKLNGTNINYPIVQTSDNSYYLTHSYNKTYNQAGWIFLDYRNDINNLSRNTIIYGHGRLDTTMFGSLKNILNSNWYEDTNNYIVKLSTETNNTLWQVFSTYRIKTTNDYIQTEFSSEEQFQEFAKMLLERSNYNFNTTINENDHILTLSTCYNNEEKVVLHAKLIKIETR